MYSIEDFESIFGEQLKVVYKEKSLNLFIKETKYLVKLRNNTINKIHSFLNQL